MFRHINFHERGHARTLPLALKVLVGLVISVLCIALTLAVFLAGQSPAPLADIVATKLGESGVENPVTAVLLNFRSYDTLLEIAVLLVVALAMMPDAKQCETQPFCLPQKANTDVSDNWLLDSFLPWLVPMVIVMAGYLLWTGAYLPGGAFQAGALLAGAGILLVVAGKHFFCFNDFKGQLLLFAGMAVFSMVGLLSAMLTGTFLQYPMQSAGSLILVIETAATISIAGILLLLFVRLSAVEQTTVKEDI